MSRPGRVLRAVVRTAFYTGCVLVLPAALAFASWWAGPS